MNQALVAGRYRLRGRLGRGRLGEIFIAEDEGYRDLGVVRRVAIQLLEAKFATDEELVDRLQQGYDLLRTGCHPNIVGYREFGHDGAFAYLVMDLLEGASLRGLLDEATSLSADEAMPIVRAIGDSLQFLHAKSMVHGRLSADSVFVTFDCDVRLLDVLPLVPPTVLGEDGVYGNVPALHDVRDDVYALACLSYEILAGHHPYNFHTAAEARLAGLTPLCIDALSADRWRALARALSYDREQRPATIRDFLREFRVAGTERLRPADEPAAGQREIAAPVAPHAVNDEPAGNIPLPAREIFVDETVQATWPEATESNARVQPGRTRNMPSPFLVLVLVGVGLWYFLGEPREDLVALTDTADAWLESQYAGRITGDAPTAVSATAPSVVPEAGTVTEDPATIATLAAMDGVDADAALQREDTRVAAAESGSAPSGDANPASAPADAPEPAVTLPAGPQFAFVRPYVSVSERDGAARIEIRRTTDSSTRVFWWTTDQSAIANDDYIPTEQPTLAFAEGRISEMLHIPLIDDGIAEPRESFYVHLGRYDPLRRQLEPVSSLRVSIDDDDQ